MSLYVRQGDNACERFHITSGKKSGKLNQVTSRILTVVSANQKLSKTVMLQAGGSCRLYHTDARRSMHERCESKRNMQIMSPAFVLAVIQPFHEG